MTYRSILVSLITLTFILSSCGETATEHPFEAYVTDPHPSYSYELQSTIEGSSHTTYVIRMVSQEWLTEEIVDETEWRHWLTVVVPNNIEHQTSLLMIGGGSHNDEPPAEAPSIVLEAALATGSVTAHLDNVPAQPLTFIDDANRERYEDDIIAYGWRMFLTGGAMDEDAAWLSRLPMTAAAMRAMDTVEDFTLSELGLTVNDFVVTGASKRGWTAWTTAIFDNRVVAIVPAVIDLLNLESSFEHHWRAYGEWSPAIEEYEEEQIMLWQESKEYARLADIVDPYSYLDSLRMPKYIINAASDEFFLPDSWQFYWHDLPGRKHLRYIPNTGHSLSGTDMHEGLIAFYSSILNRSELPQFEWSATNDQLTVRYDPANPPDRLRLWNAHNPEGRDFRLYVIDRIWMARELDIEQDGEVTVMLDHPSSGFTAWFVEAEFNSDSAYPFTETSGVVVTPDIYPYESFEAENPLGTPPDTAGYAE
ncbi:PhoPQ-activated pathogenicity-related family protein [Rhodohalobacter mucosus]|uniref:PhoPQ-activated pathogenicity-like protein PqaA type n=1 Tax=Rhodohalobacter mucosus TaxID=2079485 RepID=A0A316TVB3_9BACT|nr:PhoPQ-activated protein PqaA family protein [Rhodohalobacter mucosus]PWN07229.1 PhoPQ-activated pathogenicity-like protein PqaA type [Rhodohalobacter mucosus]